MAHPAERLRHDDDDIAPAAPRGRRVPWLVVVEAAAAVMALAAAGLMRLARRAWRAGADGGLSWDDEVRHYAGLAPRRPWRRPRRPPRLR